MPVVPTPRAIFVGMVLRLLSLSTLLCALALPVFGKDKYLRPGPIRLDHDGEKWAEKKLRKLSLEEKIGQLFMVRVRAQFLNSGNPEYLELLDTMRNYHVGSFIMTVPYEPPFLYRTGPYEAVQLLNRLQKESKLPLLVAADFERGLTSRFYGTTDFPHAMALGAAVKAEYAEAFGRITAQEARALGVHWNFMPVADVNSNPSNPIINTRSFGEDPQQVAELVAAYIRGAHAGGMLASAKHFPGHGDTATDSHLGLAQVTGDRARLQSVELPPFQRAIAAGVDSIMVAHVSVPALESDPNRVATTSPAVVTKLLRNELRFTGIAVTDALDMAALTRLYANNIGRAAVDAFKAGNDLLIMPVDLGASYRAMVEAARSGEISQPQIDASVLRILKAKASLGLNKAKLADPDALANLIAAPANVTEGQRMAEDAITLVRDNGKLLPLKQSGTVTEALPYTRLEEVHNRLVVVVLSEDVRTDSGRALAREVRARVPDAHVIYADSRVAAALSDEVLRSVEEAEAVIVAVYVIPTAGRVLTQANRSNSVALSDASGVLLEKVLEKAPAKTAVLAMGNPYLATDLPLVENYICAFSNSVVSEVSAIEALFGEIPIRGRLPVSIPGIAARGAGIDRPVKVTEGGSQDGHSQSATR